VERAALPQWIAQRLAQQGQRVARARRASARCSSLPTGWRATCWPRTRRSRSSRLLYPPGELASRQVESAVLNVARYDVFKLSEAVLAGQAARVQRMLDGLQAEGEAEVLVHYTLAEDIRALKRVKDAMAAGRPLPMALREQRVWGVRSACSSACCRA
jgi:DNA polymerase-3 subunit delta